MASCLDFAVKNLNTISLPFHKRGEKNFSPTFPCLSILITQVCFPRPSSWLGNRIDFQRPFGKQDIYYLNKLLKTGHMQGTVCASPERDQVINQTDTVPDISTFFFCLGVEFFNFLRKG